MIALFPVFVFFAEVAQTGTARAWRARGDLSPREFKSPPRRFIVKFSDKR